MLYGGVTWVFRMGFRSLGAFDAAFQSFMTNLSTRSLEFKNCYRGMSSVSMRVGMHAFPICWHIDLLLLFPSKTWAMEFSFFFKHLLMKHIQYLFRKDTATWRWYMPSHTVTFPLRLSSLFLEHWIPSVADAPPNSPQEEEFFKWLSVSWPKFWVCLRLWVCNQPPRMKLAHEAAATMTCHLLGCPSIAAPFGSQASDPIFAPHLIGARLQSRGMMLHPWLMEVPCDPKWAEEWPVLEKCPWPKLELLVASLAATGILAGKRFHFLVWAHCV